ncbi:MAG TPA: DNA topoisomerase IB [Polyangia bacterium]|nr:DNA topoisomerase IB [Polyangia bacterium]
MGRHKSDHFPVVVAAADPIASARVAGLKYVRAGSPGGIGRRRAGTGFTYFRGGRSVRDAETLQRIRSLAIPPAWQKVWICPEPNGHLQATGRDARGRKQYRYHPRWRAQRDETKFGRMIAFGKVLPRLRARVAHDMAGPGLSRDKVLATVVSLLERTLIRVGNDEYARDNHSFGLTTLEDRHVVVSGSEVRFHFRGKSGKEHQVTISDPHIARIVKRCRDIPGYELFQYVDDSGQRQTIDSADVNQYIRQIAGDDFTAKDFRTWAGTVLAALALQQFEAVASQARAKKNIVAAIEQVAARLGNTTAVCRKSYIHPAVLDCYLDGELTRPRRGRRTKASNGASGRPHHGLGLPADEAAVLSLLERHLEADRRGDRLQRQLRRSIRVHQRQRPVAARVSTAPKANELIAHSTE